MDLYFRQSTYTEDLTAAHVLQKVAHHQVRCSLYIRRRNPNDFSAVIDEGSRIGLNRKTYHVEVRIALRISLACRFKDQLLTYGTRCLCEELYAPLRDWFCDSAQCANPRR